MLRGEGRNFTPEIFRKEENMLPVHTQNCAGKEVWNGGVVSVVGAVIFRLSFRL